MWEEEVSSFVTEFGQEIYSMDASLGGGPEVLRCVVFRVTTDPMECRSCP